MGHNKEEELPSEFGHTSNVTVMFPLNRLVRNFVSRRCVATATVTQPPVQAPVQPTDMAYEQARAFKEMPKVNTLKALYQFTFTERKSKINEIVSEWYDAFGPIVVLSIPGLPHRVFVKNPKTIKTVLSLDGKNPIEPGFDHIVHYRQKLRKDIFHQTAGLLGSHGEPWYDVRSKVQQDMLRPKSAMSYITHIENISSDFLDLVHDSLDEKNEVPDLLDLVNMFALESIVIIFLDQRLGCLKKNLPENSDAKSFVNAVKVVTGHDGNELAFSLLPIWKIFPTRTFKRFDKSSIKVNDISKKYVDSAIKKLENSNVTNYDDMSVLQKLIKRCGPGSQIPLVMSQDAIMAGVDTTGTTAAFFLPDLANNPDKQDILHKEITDIIGNAKITESGIKKMKYLKACLHESQRLNNATYGMSRITQTDMVLEGYQVPKGTNVSYCVMIAGKDPSQFSDPEKFF